MANRVIIGNGTPPFRYPMVFENVVDRSAVTAPIRAQQSSAVLLIPILGDGADGVLHYVDATNEVAQFGRIKKTSGLPLKFLHKFVTGGGRAYVQVLKPENASYAHALVSLKFIKAEGKFNLDKDGNLVASETGAITLPVFNTVLDVTSAKDMNTVGEMELVASTKLDYDNDLTESSIPLHTVCKRGRGVYGSGTGITTTKLPSIYANKHPLYEVKVDDGIAYEVTPHLEVLNNGISISYDSLNEEADETISMLVYKKHISNMYSLMQKFQAHLVEAVEALDDATEGKTALLGKLAEMQNFIVDNPDFYNAIDVFNPENIFNYSVTDVVDLFKAFFPMERAYPSKITLLNGGDGDLAGLTDFDFTYSVTKTDENTGEEYEEEVLTKLFNDFYAGNINDIIFDDEEVPADFIIDLGYPVMVKKAMTGFVQEVTGRRPDMGCIVNAPVAIDTLSELRSFDTIFMPEEYQVFKLASNAPFYDEFTNSVMNKVPLSYGMDKPINEFFNGFMNGAIAGKYIQGIKGDIKPLIKEPDEYDDTYTRRWNYVRRLVDGTIKLDSQTTAPRDTVGVLSELHNMFIVNRVRRFVRMFCRKKQHLMNNPENQSAVISELQEMLEMNYKMVTFGKVTMTPLGKNGKLFGNNIVTVDIFMDTTMKTFRIDTSTFLK
jgi:hypothetical protein